MAEETRGGADAREKKVDDAWKEAIAKERQEEVRADKARDGGGEPDFIAFISGLMVEVLIALGEVENPISKKKEASLPHARLIVDILALLKEKTTNNLTKDESNALEGILYELRMKYIARVNEKGSGQ